MSTRALIASLLAKSLDSAVAAPYADNARSKGASEARVQFRHALRNALTSTITIAGDRGTAACRRRGGRDRVLARRPWRANRCRC